MKVKICQTKSIGLFNDLLFIANVPQHTRIPRVKNKSCLQIAGLGVTAVRQDDGTGFPHGA
jgi:hypothetical protein